MYSHRFFDLAQSRLAIHCIIVRSLGEQDAAGVCLCVDVCGAESAKGIELLIAEYHGTYTESLQSRVIYWLPFSAQIQ